jgi:hypothetical protein
MNGMFAIISAHNVSNSNNGLIKDPGGGAILTPMVGNIYNSNVGVVHDMDLGYNVKTIRLSVKDRRGFPLKCHRAHFWLKVMATK